MADDNVSVRQQQEILRRLDEIRNGGIKTPDPIPLIDPTANVLKHVEGAVSRINDLMATQEAHRKEIRSIEARHSNKVTRLEQMLTKAETDRLNAISEKESARVDARLAESQMAVALARVEQANQSSAFDKRITTVEQNQYQATGKSQGLGQGWGVLVGAIGIISALVALWFRGH